MRKKHGWAMVLGALVITQCGWAVWSAAAALPSKLVDISMDEHSALYNGENFIRVHFHLADGTVLSHNGLGKDRSYFVLKGKIAVNQALQGTLHFTAQYGPSAITHKASAPIGTGKFTLEGLGGVLTNKFPVICPGVPAGSPYFYYGCVEASAHANATHLNQVTSSRRTTRFELGRLRAWQQVFCSGNSCYPVIYGATYDTP